MAHEAGVWALRGLNHGDDHVEGRVAEATPCRPGRPQPGRRRRLLEVDSGVLAVHAALLPTGSVLFFAGSSNDEIAAIEHRYGTRVWHYPGPELSAPTTPVDLFCCGHATLPDGRLDRHNVRWSRTRDLRLLGEPLADSALLARLSRTTFSSTVSFRGTRIPRRRRPSRHGWRQRRSGHRDDGPLRSST